MKQKNNIMEKSSHNSVANGKICYIEIPAVDIGESSAFYQKVFGWDIRKRGDGSVAFDDAVAVSGTWVLDRKPATETGLLVSIMVDDMTAALAAVTENGGRIVQPVGMDAPEITAHFSDPAGNVVGLYQHRG
jgi:predicted enzyme related to lactoylglutathione lyase